MGIRIYLWKGANDVDLPLISFWDADKRGKDVPAPVAQNSSRRLSGFSRSGSEDELFLDALEELPPSL